MALYIIGIGLNDEKDITLKGLEAVKKCDFVYLESYTSVLQCSKEKLEELYGKKIILADRKLVEQDAEKTILENAKPKDVAFLVVGDAMSATTHIDLMLRARKEGIKTEVIHNASVLTAVGATGLQLYKFGKTTSIPFPEQNYQPETFYDTLIENQKLGLHTLILLDLRPSEKMFMKVSDAIRILFGVGMGRGQRAFTEKTFCIGCARLGSKDQKIKAGTANDLLKEDFGKAPHCLIVPGKLHFMEEDALKLWR